VFYHFWVRWIRGWTYELRWERGYDGIRARQVDSVAKLRAVVEWARRNPHIEKCSYKVTYSPEGDMVETCSSGHSLLTPKPNQPYRMELALKLVGCPVCPGHYLTVCPECGEDFYDPPLDYVCLPGK